MKRKYSLTVAIPAYNEEQTLERVSSQALSVVKKITSDYELLLVNDGSTDKTGEIMDRLAKRNKRVRLIQHRKNKGFSGAICTSLFSAKKDLVFLGPADGQFDYRQMEKFLRVIDNCDVAVALRTRNVEPWQRKLQSKFYHLLAWIFFGIRLREFTSVTLWRRSVLDGIKVISSPRSNTAQIEIFYKVQKKGARFTQVPISWGARKGGEAKGRINFALIFSSLVDILRLFIRERIF